MATAWLSEGLLCPLQEFVYRNSAFFLKQLQSPGGPRTYSSRCHGWAYWMNFSLPELVIAKGSHTNISEGHTSLLSSSAHSTPPPHTHNTNNTQSHDKISYAVMEIRACSSRLRQHLINICDNTGIYVVLKGFFIWCFKFNTQAYYKVLFNMIQRIYVQ